jgi:hypothetical protein
MNGLVDFLFSADPTRAREFMSRFEAAGLETPLKYGGSTPSTSEHRNLNPEDQKRRRTILLLEMSLASLEQAVKLFDGVMEKVTGRLKKAERLRTVSAVITALLSSGVVASLLQDPNSRWVIPLGFLTAAASIANVVAGRLEGGDTNLLQNFSDISAKHETARNLLDLLRVYAKDPSLFEDDVDGRLKEVEGLVVFLNNERRRLGIIT